MRISQHMLRPSGGITLMTGARRDEVNNYGDDYGADPRRRRVAHAAFRVGIRVGVALAIVYFVSQLLTQRCNGWFPNPLDRLIWAGQVITYYFAGRAAARLHYERQMDSLDPGRGVRGAAVGAAYTVALVVWCYQLGRLIVCDALGNVVEQHSLWVYLMILGDVALAGLVGGLAGRQIQKRYCSY